jgi:hypothetical protein
MSTKAAKNRVQVFGRKVRHIPNFKRKLLIDLVFLIDFISRKQPQLLLYVPKEKV